MGYRPLFHQTYVYLTCGCYGQVKESTVTRKRCELLEHGLPSLVGGSKVLEHLAQGLAPGEERARLAVDDMWQAQRVVVCVDLYARGSGGDRG
jgi:hypothetical protein